MAVKAPSTSVPAHQVLKKEGRPVPIKPTIGYATASEYVYIHVYYRCMTLLGCMRCMVEYTISKVMYMYMYM